MQNFTPTATTEPSEWWAAPRKEKKKINGLIILTARMIWLERKR